MTSPGDCPNPSSTLPVQHAAAEMPYKIIFWRTASDPPQAVDPGSRISGSRAPATAPPAVTVAQRAAILEERFLRRDSPSLDVVPKPGSTRCPTAVFSP